MPYTTQDLAALFAYLAHSAEEITGISKPVLAFAMAEEMIVKILEDKEWKGRWSAPREFWIAIIKSATDPSITVDHLQLIIEHRNCGAGHPPNFDQADSRLGLEHRPTRARGMGVVGGWGHFAGEGGGLQGE